MTVSSKGTIKFGTIDAKGNMTNVRRIPNSSIDNCPFRILTPSHYRKTKSARCRCDDPKHLEMAENGYVWNEKEGVWNGVE